MKKTLLILFLAALSRTTLLAQAYPNGHTIEIKEKSSTHIPSQDQSAGLVGIFSNLGSRTDAYNDRAALGLCGPNASCGFTQFVGMPFKPKSDSTVLQIRATVQYNGSGANQVNLSLYNDSGGIPGTLLAGPITVTNLPASGTCCTLAIANLISGVAVTAGTQYWVVADTPSSGRGSDFSGGWDFLYPTTSFGIDSGTGWFSNIGDEPGAAGAVLGTTP